MSFDSALNPNTPVTNSSRDEDDLKALKLQDSDLDHFATYFELAFQGSSQSITVLVALLQRLRRVEKLRQDKQSGIWIDDIVGRLTHRLYTRCEPGMEAAHRFGTEASDLAEHIFSEAFATPERVVGFVAGGRPK
jgi:hypothetical protein